MQLTKVQHLIHSVVNQIASMRVNRMRLNPRHIAIALAVSGATVVTTANAARDTIQIAGSSTVLPYASIVAEEFGNTFPQFKAPVVGSGGTGGGLKQFCQGVGDNTIDIADSSRPIKESELEACKAAGVTEVQEIRIGYDGIVFASDIKGPDWVEKLFNYDSVVGINVDKMLGFLKPQFYSITDKSTEDFSVIALDHYLQ